MSKISTSSFDNAYGDRRYIPYAFTKEGIYMFKKRKTVEQCKALIRIFRFMKDFLIENNILEERYINNMVLK